MNAPHSIAFPPRYTRYTRYSSSHGRLNRFRPAPGGDIEPRELQGGLVRAPHHRRGLAGDAHPGPSGGAETPGFDRGDGLSKPHFDESDHRLLGMATCGDLIAGGTLAIEMGADARDIALTIHPHPSHFF